MFSTRNQRTRKLSSGFMGAKSTQVTRRSSRTLRETAMEVWRTRWRVCSGKLPRGTPSAVPDSEGSESGVARATVRGRARGRAVRWSHQRTSTVVRSSWLQPMAAKMLGLPRVRPSGLSGWLGA